MKQNNFDFHILYWSTAHIERTHSDRFWALVALYTRGRTNISIHWCHVLYFHYSMQVLWTHWNHYIMTPSGVKPLGHSRILSFHISTPELFLLSGYFVCFLRWNGGTHVNTVTLQSVCVWQRRTKPRLFLKSSSQFRSNSVKLMPHIEFFS